MQETLPNEVNHWNMEYKSVMKEDFLKLELKLGNEIKEVRMEIKDTKSDILKWFAGIFLTLALLIIGLYIKK